VVAYRDQNLPGKPVWWTEFGYDTYVNSPLHAPALGSNTAFIVQGQWLVRDLLAALAAGIDRATLFELDDTCTPPATACNTQFATCGLLAETTSAPKPSWYFLATFRARLQTMVYAGSPASGQSDVKIAQFTDTKSSGGALVVWAPTSNATVHTGYSLALPSGATSATAVALVDKQQNGTATILTPSGGAVTLDVSETPTIVLYGP
jgi:endoglucanase